ncbi:MULTISPECIES: LysM peptidoglycan-binding domain-containing protein [Arthrobacter]|uniref:LysM domain-containing protein n=1 Tax=Arthrobacter psychrochitiniphilus TaxID=291045 RepID=A0A2V3DPI5_9MICC|nr:MULTISPECIES: hypothetical protein [Arthrobacter]NYG18353.1 hypothetical protein [Arthrobacter psychrochitiniphilus]PXA64870.1 hypothetical protein CVS29_11735 [Arthrobacter psychrochitiniphilus]
MKPQTRADLAMTAAIAFLGAALVFSGFALLRLQWGGRSMAPTLGFPELLGVAGAGIGFALLCWWLFALCCACLSAFAQRFGAHRLSTLTARWSPAFMRRVVAAIIGINLLGAPLAGAAQAAGVAPLWHTLTVSTAPISGAVSTPSPSSPPVDPLWVPHTPDIAPDLLIRTSPREPADQPEFQEDPTAASGDLRSGDVVVKKGDTLWGIVAEALGPYSTDVEVALAWPQWYGTNRSTIGADPNLILPGQILHAPGNY